MLISKRERVIFNNVYMLSLAWKCNPSYVVITLIDGLIKGLHTSINLLYTFALLNSIENSSEIKDVYAIILSYAIYLTVYYLLFYLHKCVYDPLAREKIRISVHKMLFKQAVGVDLKCYDNKVFYNNFVWAMNQAHSQAITLIQNTGKLITYLIASIASFRIMVNIDYMVALLIVGLSVCRIILRKMRNNQNLSFKNDCNEVDRKDAYFKRIFARPEYAKELRISQIGTVFLKKMKKNSEKKIELERNYSKKRIVLDVGVKTIDVVGNSIALIIILYKVMVLNSLSIGAFSITIMGLWQMSRLLSGLIDFFLKYHETAVFSKKVIEFMNYPVNSSCGELRPSSMDTLEFRNISFAYQEGKKVLDNVSMKINKGDKIAIVGCNGAGKTTLIKLLMRLYDPNEGKILYNGIDIRQYNIDQLRDEMSVVFQDYCIFAATIAENVVSGEFSSKDESRVIEALEKSTFSSRLSSLPKGINTMLTREFDKEGVQLSGGESQKIAIARAFYNNSELIVMDEPSAALDPDSEYYLNKSITSNSTDKTIIFISHRLSTTRNADKIYVFENGKIIESGKHDELIKSNGRYAYLFNLQAKKYVNEN